jgi:hypothetical protein
MRACLIWWMVLFILHAVLCVMLLQSAVVGLMVCAALSSTLRWRRVVCRVLCVPWCGLCLPVANKIFSDNDQAYRCCDTNNVAQRQVLPAFRLTTEDADIGTHAKSHRVCAFSLMFVARGKSMWSKHARTGWAIVWAGYLRSLLRGSRNKNHSCRWYGIEERGVGGGGGAAVANGRGGFMMRSRACVCSCMCVRA